MTTDQEKSNVELPDSLYKQVLDHAEDMIMIMSPNFKDVGESTIVYVNDAFSRLMGYPKDEVIGQSPKILQGENTDPQTRLDIRDAMLNSRPIRTEILNYTKQGKELWLDINLVPLLDDTGKVTHFMAIERDLSARKTLENQLRQDATIDGLTGIFNRSHCYKLTEQLLQQAHRFNEVFCVIMLDIDHFKTINDNFGHLVGDRVLTRLADIIKNQIRRSDVFGRVGGEEFFLLLTDIKMTEARKFAERIRHYVAANTWHELNGEHQMTVSLGVTQLNQKDDLESLIARVDSALYVAKNNGRNMVSIK